jgi:hypothetical protein
MQQWINDVAQGKGNGKYWASLDNGGLEIELNQNNVPAAIQQQVLSIEGQVKAGQIQTNPLGPLIITPYTFVTAATLQVSRNFAN